MKTKVSEQMSILKFTRDVTIRIKASFLKKKCREAAYGVDDSNKFSVGAFKGRTHWVSWTLPSQSQVESCQDLLLKPDTSPEVHPDSHHICWFIYTRSAVKPLELCPGLSWKEYVSSLGLGFLTKHRATCIALPGLWWLLVGDEVVPEIPASPQRPASYAAVLFLVTCLPVLSPSKYHVEAEAHWGKDLESMVQMRPRDADQIH